MYSRRLQSDLGATLIVLHKADRNRLLVVFATILEKNIQISLTC